MSIHPKYDELNAADVILMLTKKRTLEEGMAALKEEILKKYGSALVRIRASESGYISDDDLENAGWLIPEYLRERLDEGVSLQ